MDFNPFGADVDRWLKIKRKFIQFSARFLLFLSLFNILLVIYDVGFELTSSSDIFISKVYNYSLILHFVFLLLKFIAEVNMKTVHRTRKISEFILLFIMFLVIDARMIFTTLLQSEFFLFDFLSMDFTVYALFVLVFLIEFSKSSMGVYKISLNPALIFILSFLFIIAVGTGLLLLPNATTGDISFIDALFTSTSAVCVTGLIVVDTATDLTQLGQFFVLLLIQAGGLGIMTFTSFFGFFFRGNTTYQSQLFLKELVNEEQLGQIFRTLIKIVVFTFSIEFIGFLLIYYATDEAVFAGTGERLWFSIFHTVSAFCNAGFSTLTNSLYESGFRVNYDLHLIIAILIVIGGLGFPIIFNFWKYVKSYVLRLGRKYYTNIPLVHVPRLINVNTKIVVITTASLLLFGIFFFFLSEYDNSLAGRSAYGKVVTTIFGAVTPRTAGFNTVDMTALALPTIMLYLFLMWIGASPGSTGGGIKTSTFALAVMNTISISRGRDRVEVFRREIQNESIRRALSILFLSFIVIGFSIFFLTLFDPHLGLIEIIFECFSAFSTVGLSLGITSSLGTASKVVIIFTMFIGRVGTLTVIIAFIRKVRNTNYRYPEESIFIN